MFSLLFDIWEGRALNSSPYRFFSSKNIFIFISILLSYLKVIVATPLTIHKMMTNDLCIKHI